MRKLRKFNNKLSVNSSGTKPLPVKQIEPEPLRGLFFVEVGENDSGLEVSDNKDTLVITLIK